MSKGPAASLYWEKILLIPFTTVSTAENNVILKVLPPQNLFFTFHRADEKRNLHITFIYWESKTNPWLISFKWSHCVQRMKKPPCPFHSYSFLSFSSLRLLPVPQTPCSLPLEGSPPQPILVQLPSTTNFNVSSSSNFLWHGTLTSSSCLECWIQTPTKLFSQLQGLLCYLLSC